MLLLCREKEVAALQVELDAKSAEAVSLASKVAELNEKNCEWKTSLVKHSTPMSHTTLIYTHTHTHTHLFPYSYTHCVLSTLWDIQEDTERVWDNIREAVIVHPQGGGGEREPAQPQWWARAEGDRDGASAGQGIFLTGWTHNQDTRTHSSTGRYNY